MRVGSFILNHKEFADYTENFFGELKRRHVSRLILDLRGNWGGPPKSSVLLFSYLIDRPVPYLDRNAPIYFAGLKRTIRLRADRFDGTLIVLTDGAVFSTTGHLVSRLRHHNRGIPIGEVTGGGASCADATHHMELSNTGLRLNYATRIFSTPAPVDPKGKGLSPDIMISPTIEDILDGRDPVMTEAAEIRSVQE
ncbi:MAG: S41 family peptidase [Spirochaetaceae bacterium]|nr:S41 family peptidase [Spirochaetaceae bacterium]MDT8297461.1 S41 family peptidase [Spirochaetaceae bacterium]